ncbi:hypothetical protein ACFQV8_08865 [Pseudonocardia benzenivorans]
MSKCGSGYSSPSCDSSMPSASSAARNVTAVAVAREVRACGISTRALGAIPAARTLPRARACSSPRGVRPWSPS